ncbi:MAG: methyltransferase domain-containing protein [Methanobrevibacter sp.]|uniref:METTL5 family protein n=1 Tax=Methanobrevibacter sp. TaxID=66852 RepID=UPI0025D086B0|nr:METTL5 family protein [Methanobrevibacter sp.]MBR3112756.1 methyltransferase domain-containing protein [Methanobrevibacter sp.]MBR6993245.1 methyltransferase domain-containing protein [Methanobrevibacter sp.]
MKKITRKKHLEMRLQNIPSHPKPKVGLEQYTTPSVIASDLIWNAFGIGDIEDKNIVDLGCGTGIFAIGSALMGANSSVGVDIDEDSIKLARDVSEKLKVDNVEFIVNDIDEFNQPLNTDTLFQNPPFGSQRNADKGQDLKFVKKAIEIDAKVIYSFHMASTEEFLIKFYEDNNLKITHIFRYKFPIPKIYEFHNKEKQIVNVIVIRAEF